MNNISISKKIMVLLLLPLMGLFIYAAENATKDVRIWRSMTMTVTLMDIAVAMGALNHNLQVERGATVGYLKSKGTNFSDVLPGYQKSTDEKLTELKALYEKNSQDMPPAIRGKIEAALEATNGLGDIRRQVSGLNIPIEESSKYFTNTISVILATLPAIAEQSGDFDVIKRMTSYIAFQNAKERNGQERALLAAVFTADRIEPAQYRAFLKHGEAQQTYIAIFKRSADESLLGLYKQKEESEPFKSVDAMRETVVNKVTEGDFKIDPTLWFKTMTNKIEAMREVEEMAATQIKTSAQERAQVAFSDLLFRSGRSVIFLLVTLVLGSWITRSVTRSLKMLKTSISDVQKSNDLTHRLEIDGKDEVGQTADAFNRLIESLRASMVQVVKSSDSVLQMSRQVAVASTEVATSSQYQSDAASSMAASVEEMTVSIDQISEHASQAQESSGSSKELAEHGGEIILQVLKDMRSIAENVHQSSTIIEELGNQSNQIHSIVQVIKEIADQTNLLALNAAIEAARAGEQGRGFAVVADEVRKLAERTTGSTEEIAVMIGKIQDGARQAVASMDVGVNCVNKGVTLAREADEAIRKIQQSSLQVSVAITDISSAIREQSIASNEIAQNVEKVAQMTDENSAATQNSSEVAMDLQNLAVELKEGIAKFRI